MVKTGDIIVINKEWQDDGDSDYTWTAISDENPFTGVFKALVTGGSFPSVMELYADQVEVCES